MAPPKKHWKFSCLHVLPSLEPDLQNDGNKNQQRCGRAGRGLFSPCLVASNLLPTVSRILCIDLCILLELTKRYLKGPKGVVTEDPWISTGGLTRLRPPWWMPLKMTRTGATLGCTQHGLVNIQTFNRKWIGWRGLEYRYVTSIFSCSYSHYQWPLQVVLPKWLRCSLFGQHLQGWGSGVSPMVQCLQ